MHFFTQKVMILKFTAIASSDYVWPGAGSFLLMPPFIDLEKAKNHTEFFICFSYGYEQIYKLSYKFLGPNFKYDLFQIYNG